MSCGHCRAFSQKTKTQKEGSFDPLQRKITSIGPNYTLICQCDFIIIGDAYICQVSQFDLQVGLSYPGLRSHSHSNDLGVYDRVVPELKEEYRQLEN